MPLSDAERQALVIELNTLILEGKTVDDVSPSGKTALCLAVELGTEVEFIKKELLDKGASVDKPTPSGITPLIMALREGYTDIALALIEHGANVNVVDGLDNHSALHEAVSKNLNPAVEALLNNGANLLHHDALVNCTPAAFAVLKNNYINLHHCLMHMHEVTEEGFFGSTLLHLAIECNKSNMALLILDSPLAEKMLKHPDIYGRTPLDLAMSYGMDAVIGKITGLPKDQFSKELGYNKPPINIGHRRQIQQLKRYLELKKRDTVFYSEKGICNGLAFFAGYYAWRHRSGQTKHDEFHSILKMLATWDGAEASLKDTFFIGTLTDKYKDLGDFFEQWANDLMWFQHEYALSSHSGISQIDRQKQLEMVSGHKLNHLFSVTARLDKSQLVELLKQLATMPNTMISLGGFGHAVNINILPNGHFSYYDTNCDYKLPLFTSAEKLADFIQKTKYQRLSADDPKKYDPQEIQFMQIHATAYQFDPQLKDMPDPCADEECLYQLLCKTKAFTQPGQLTFVEDSINFAARYDNPQSIRAHLRYIEKNSNYAEQVKMAIEAAILFHAPCSLLAILEREFVVDDAFITHASGINNRVLNTEVDQRRAKIIDCILMFQRHFPMRVHLQPDATYAALVAAIEKNNVVILTDLLKKQSVSTEDLQDLIHRAVMLENVDSLKILLKQAKFPLNEKYLEFAQYMENLPLVECIDDYMHPAKKQVDLKLFTPTKSVSVPPEVTAAPEETKKPPQPE